MLIVFDIGANSGSFGLELARKRPDVCVHLVEPDDQLARQLRSCVASESLNNVLIHEVAILSTDSVVDIKISDQGDKGTSSLLPFNMAAINQNEYWRYRTDLKHDRTIAVNGIRLETLFKENGVSNIDFIKIDVQGLDLEVLESAGEYVKYIRAGMLEVPTLSHLALYEGENQNLRSAFNVLEKLGFSIIYIKPNDPACNEVNIYFTRDMKGWRDLVQDLGLVGIENFDGKDYWHSHSSSPLYADTHHQSLILENKQLQNRISILDDEVNRLNQEISRRDIDLRRLDEHILLLKNDMNLKNVS